VKAQEEKRKRRFGGKKKDAEGKGYAVPDPVEAGRWSDKSDGKLPEGVRKKNRTWPDDVFLYKHQQTPL